MITYFAEVNMQLRVHENCLDIHGALLEIKSWKLRVRKWSQDFKYPQVSEHQGCLWGPDVLVWKLEKKKVILKSVHSNSFFGI